MYFKNDEHRDLFLALRQRAGQGNDCEYTAAIYVLAGIGNGKPVSKHVLPGEIKFPALFRSAKVWSSSEKALAKLAATLFNYSSWPAKIGDIFYHLDEQNSQVAIQALKIRYLMR